MPNRMSLVSVLAAIVPTILVLLAVLALAPPSSPAPPDGTSAAPAAPDSRSSGAMARPSEVPAKARPPGPAAPELLGGGAWINSEPLTLAGLKGKVVLIDFWTYGCYNCQNTLPYVKQWWEKYKDQGLVIVGVHTPEFASEHVLDNVQSAVERAGIGWPVVQDNDYKIWRAYGNNYWPRFYLIDGHGQVIYDHIGEGAYEETERQIQAALAAAKANRD